MPPAFPTWTTAIHPALARTASDAPPLHLTSASGLSIHERPLAYEQALTAREPGSVDLVVVHCTELPDLETARVYGERIQHVETQTGNSGHFYIDRNGRVEQWVTPARVAHHVRGFNERSIGIELVNSGRFPDWLHSQKQEMREPYAEEQIVSLLRLLAAMTASFGSVKWIAGHSDLDEGLVTASDDATTMVRRKLDPGPLFPWPLVLESTPLKRFRP